MKQQAGFTFLELMLVLLIMGLLAGMVAPTLSSLKKERDLYAAAQVAATATNFARSLAVTTGRRSRLGMDRETSRMDLLVEEDPMGDPGNFTRRDWPTGLTGTLPKGIHIEQVYYPVIREEGEEEETSSSKKQEQVEYQSEEEAAEERQSVLVFEPDGSTRDTFIYLSVGDASATIEASTGEATARMNTFTVAIVGTIGSTVIVPRYTEEIFEVYDTVTKP
jgi:type II secretion system protein H